MGKGQEDDPGSAAALGLVHWNRYDESGDVGELAIALRICERVRASGAGTGGLPEVLTTALDWVAAVVGGEVPDATIGEDQRDAWVALLFALGGIWWADADDDPSALDRVIGAVSLAAGILGEEDPRLIRVLGFLGPALTRRGARDERAGDLESAVEVLDDALSRTPRGDERYGQLLSFRANALLELHGLEPSPQHATDLAQAMLDALGELDADDPTAQALAQLARAITFPVDSGGTPDQILVQSRLLLTVCPPGDPGRIVALYFTAKALHDRAGMESSLPDNAQAISAARELAATLEEGDGQLDLRASAASLLFLCLLQRYEQAGDTAALLEAIDLARSAFDLPLADPALRAYRLVDLGVGLEAEHEASGDRRSLDEAIRALAEAISIPEIGEQAGRGQSLLGIAYLTRFRLDGSAEDLDRAAEHCHAAVQATPPDRSDYPEWAGNLSQVLWLRHRHRGTQPDLEDALRLARHAVGTTRPGHADHARHCQNLGSILLALYRQTGAGTDLDQAIAAFEEAAAVVRPGAIADPVVKSSLSAALQERFDLLGRAADLDTSAALVRSALQDLPEGSQDRSIALYGLNAVLHKRYVHTGSEADLGDAVTAGRLALAAAPPGSDDAIFARSNLSYTLQSRFRLAGQRQDIDEAVALLRAVDGPAVGADLRPSVHANLAAALSARFEALSEPSDLDDAITEIRAALNAAGPSPRRIRYQANLGGLLDLRGRDRDAPRDVAEAITLLRAAVSATGAGQPERGDRVLGLARVLLSRHHRTGSAEDRAEAMRLGREAAHIGAASAGTRMTAARLWAELAGDLDGLPAGLEGWRYAMNLLPLIAWPGLSRKDQERQLAEISGLASHAAASAISGGDPELAVEFLEHGRGLLWTQIAEARSDFSQLADAHPGHARRLTEVRAALDVHLNADLGVRLGPADTDRSQLAREWNTLLDEVRARPGFEGFLRPPGFADLAAAASEGPVVLINVSDLRSDALIVDTGGVRVVPLPGLTHADLAAHLNALYNSPALTPERPSEVAAASLMITGLLAWLWTAVAGPVADELGNAERVWWCPTGHLALLPLHAAMDPATQECVADRFMSSYTPTLRALITARAAPPGRIDEETILLVAVPDAPGTAALNVQPEIDEIASRFPGQLSILSGSAATRNNALTALPGHRCVHFACHASQNIGDPSASALILHDGPLTVLDMAGLRIPHGELAFLSACQTAGGGAALPDESIHLAAALQAVGFRNVIATFWPVYDALAPAVAKAFYEGLAREGTTASTGQLLHNAVRRLRARAPTPAVWAPYAHFGP